MYALVDCNCFYVSCERVFNPALHGKPVVVLSNNDGCAVSRSDEAKALGIGMAAPIFRFRETVKRHQVVCLSSNYALYGDMSGRVMSVFGTFTPDVEVYSIDEAFLRFHETDSRRLREIGEEIRAKVLRWTGIPVSAGMGETKTLAKAASALAKRKKSGVFVLENPEALRELPVEKVWGVGRQHNLWLREHGIETAFDLRNAPEQLIRQGMTVVGHRMVLELRGIPCIPFEEAPPEKKAMAYARSFGRLLQSRDEIRETVAYYAERISAKLRSEGVAAGCVSVFLETNPFRSEDPQYRASNHAELPVPTNFTPEISAKALWLLGRIFKPGYKYKKAGVLVMELVPESQVQGELFDAVERHKAGKLMVALDGVNARYGRDKVGFASAHATTGWQPRFAYRSNRFTTRWDELPVAS